MIDYAKILTKKYVGKQWSLSGNSYDNLEWLDSSPKPTQAELDSLWGETQAQIQAEAQAIIDTKVSALAKLTALGLTQAEITALVGS